MEIRLSDKNGKEIRFLKEAEIDIENHKRNDFELTIKLDDWKGDINYGYYIYIPGTELGGIVSKIKSSTKEQNIFVYGSTFRGILAKKIIEPARGEDYRTVSGELNEVLRELVEECTLSSLFSVPTVDTEVLVTFQFDRYCTLLEGMEKMLNRVGYRLDIRYIKNNVDAYVRLQAVHQVDYSGRKEFSQDGGLSFVATNDQGGVNHLICLGKGELKDRIVKHLYVQKNGSIGEQQYYTGIEENTETYDYSSAEEPELTEKGTERLKERMNSKKFEVDIEDDIEIDMQIGDIVGGRDYITGIHVKKPIVGKIYTCKNGIENTEYKIEGDN